MYFPSQTHYIRKTVGQMSAICLTKSTFAFFMIEQRKFRLSIHTNSFTEKIATTLVTNCLLYDILKRNIVLHSSVLKWKPAFAGKHRNCVFTIESRTPGMVTALEAFQFNSHLSQHVTSKYSRNTKSLNSVSWAHVYTDTMHPSLRGRREAGWRWIGLIVNRPPFRPPKSN